jgi:hypothetical protein
MYQIEFSDTAVADLEDLTLVETAEVLSLLSTWSDNPKPAGVQSIPLPEAADGIAYLYETDYYSIYYNIFETARVVRIVAIFKKISSN